MRRGGRVGLRGRAGGAAGGAAGRAARLAARAGAGRAALLLAPGGTVGDPTSTFLC